MTFKSPTLRTLAAHPFLVPVFIVTVANVLGILAELAFGWSDRAVSGSILAGMIGLFSAMLHEETR